MHPTPQLTIEVDDGVELLFACPVEGCGRRAAARSGGGSRPSSAAATTGAGPARAIPGMRGWV